MIEFTIKRDEELVPQLQKIQEEIIDYVKDTENEVSAGIYSYVTNQFFVLCVAIKEEHVTEHEAHQMCKTIAATLSLMSR